jgi:hypothetical protein
LDSYNLGVLRRAYEHAAGVIAMMREQERIVGQMLDGERDTPLTEGLMQTLVAATQAIQQHQRLIQTQIGLPATSYSQ